MIKKLMILSTFTLLGACSTTHYTNSEIGSLECDGKTESDKVAAEEYRNLRASGQMKSALIITKGNLCDDQGEVCSKFSPARYDFIETEYNNEKRKGIYTIHASKDIKSPECIGEPIEFEGTQYCYTITKNPNDQILSRYKFTLVNGSDYKIAKIDDLKTKTQVMKISECNLMTNQRSILDNVKP